MRYLVVFFLLITSLTAFSQENTTIQKVSGTIQNDNTLLPIANVNVINLNKAIGTTTSTKGYFEIEANVNDTLHISFIGFQSLKVRVTNDWIKNKTTKKNKIKKLLLLTFKNKTFSIFPLKIPKISSFQPCPMLLNTDAAFSKVPDFKKTSVKLT